jgi:hypothetical protein
VTQHSPPPPRVPVLTCRYCRCTCLPFPPFSTPPPVPPPPCSDSHAKSLYKALQCFLIDFWNHQECETSSDSGAVSQLFNLPERSGFQKCLHLMGPGGGRICIVEVVLGTSFANSDRVSGVEGGGGVGGGG